MKKHPVKLSQCMYKLKAFLIIFILPFFFVISAPAGSPSAEKRPLNSRCIKDVCFAPVQKIGGQELPFRGGGLMEYWKLDLYTAALYVPESAKSLPEVLGNVPRSLIIHYHRGIKISWMLRAARKTLKKHPEINFEKIRERVDDISAAYQKVGDGDRYELRYVPGEGTSLLLNGISQITIPGEDFARAYFGIWLSKYPINKKLRDKLLNQTAKPLT